MMMGPDYCHKCKHRINEEEVGKIGPYCWHNWRCGKTETKFKAAWSAQGKPEDCPGKEEIRENHCDGG